MSTTMTKPSTSTTQAGFPPAPPETHQRAGGFVIERTAEGFAAKLLANPAKGAWLRKVGAGGYLLREPNGYRFTIAEAWVTAHHAGAARALAAVEAIELGNNGHADIGADEATANAVEAAGFTVIRTKDLHGRLVYRGFTARAQAALRGAPYGASTYGKPSQALDLPDYEAAILARQERHFEGI